MVQFHVFNVSTPATCGHQFAFYEQRFVICEHLFVILDSCLLIVNICSL